MKNIKDFTSYTSNHLNEDNIGTAYTRQGGYQFIPGSEIVLDGNLFNLGIDKVNKNSVAFKNAIEAMKSAGMANLEIEGGASAVGSDKGYDNEALALRRANNFIKAAREAGVTANMLAKAKVGTATVANSPEANAEQYVKVIYKSAPRGYTVLGIDNATVAKKPPVDAETLSAISKTGFDYKILKVVYPKGELNKVMKDLQNAASKLKTTVYDVSKAYNDKGYKL